MRLTIYSNDDPLEMITREYEISRLEEVADRVKMFCQNHKVKNVLFDIHGEAEVMELKRGEERPLEALFG